MEISQIKSQLCLSEVLDYYKLLPKNGMLNCFLHEDSHASMQLNFEKNYYKCHGCGKTGDQIQFIEDFEKLSKSEAINKAKSLIGSLIIDKKIDSEFKRNNILEIETEEKLEEKTQTRLKFLVKMFEGFQVGLKSSNLAKEYLEIRGLRLEKIDVGYNSGQFHQREKRTDELLQNCLDFGFLKEFGESKPNKKTQEKGIIINKELREKQYCVFGKNCIVFPLKNIDNKIVSLYFRSIFTPSSNNENKLSTAMSRHFYLKNRCGIYPNYPNKNTKKLILTESIIDAASLLQIKKISENYSVLACFGTNGLNNEILQAIKNLEELEEIIFGFDNDEAGKTATVNYSNLLIKEKLAVKISILDLPNKDINEVLQLHSEEIFFDLIEKRKEIIFSNEEKSEKRSDENPEGKVPKKSNFVEKDLNLKPKIISGILPEIISFLRDKNLIKNLNDLIGKSGIVGEENSRLLLFLIVISYKNKHPLHALVQGSSGSGKTHLINKIVDMIPSEDVLRFTRITEGSLYNYGEFDLINKVILIEDLDGLKEEALYALRELISNQRLSSLTSIKDKRGNNKGTKKEVKGRFSSLSATTKGETYEDNMNRSFVIAIDENHTQTDKIIDYQNEKISGKLNLKEEEISINFIQKLVINLNYYEVINPYATMLHLPEKVRNKRRLNEMYQSVIKQVTLLNQYQRELSNNHLITDIEDIKQATEILFESIILKIDELDGSLRHFLETLRKGVDNEVFTRFDAMRITGFKKSQLQVYLNELVRFGYLKQSGFVNKGFSYKLGYNDDIQKIRSDLKEHFKQQINKLAIKN